MSAPALATFVLRVDAVANAALAAGVLALHGTLTEAAGLSNGWPLVVVALVLTANAALCWSAASGAPPSSRALRKLAGVDAVFTAAVFWFALVDPTGMANWLQTLLIALALLVAAVAVAKVLLARAIPMDRTVPLRS